MNGILILIWVALALVVPAVKAANKPELGKAPISTPEDVRPAPPAVSVSTDWDEDDWDRDDWGGDGAADGRGHYFSADEGGEGHVASVGLSRSKQLEQLEVLRKAGLLDEDEYKQRKQKIKRG